MQHDLRALLFEITSKCNAGCDHCGSRCGFEGTTTHTKRTSTKETLTKETLTKEDILSTLTDIKENLGTDIMINITGGEPLMRNDLFEIMSEVTKLGFDWGMVSNGSLITKDVVTAMKNTGMKTITISVDGLAYTHDSLRHIKGGFDKIIKALKLLKKANFLDCLQITFTANHKNVYEFPEVYRIMRRIGIDSIRLGFIDSIGRAKDHNELLLSKEEMEFLFWFVNKMNKKGKLPIEWGCPHYFGTKAENRRFYCFAGIHVASVLSNGDIFVCPNVPRRPEFIQGNVKRDAFSEVWENGFKDFRERVLPEKCKSCRHKDACAGDSMHSMNFDTMEPKFCYKDIFENHQHKKYFEFLKKKYGTLMREVICDEEDEKKCVNEKNADKKKDGKKDYKAPTIYLEPGAYEDLRQYFHMGEKHPLSMYEQQLGLVGFRLGRDYVIRYVFPANAHKRYKDNAIFAKDILKHAFAETKIIQDNFYESDDRGDFIGTGVGETSNGRTSNGGLQFLGFAHTHPIQSELTYSIGDELIHRRMNKILKDHYIGILANPKDDTIGAYVGRKIKQGRLVLLQKK